MINKYKIRILLVALAVSLVLNIALLMYASYVSQEADASETVVGTFCDNLSMTGEGLYIAFLPDGNYSIYRQNEPLEEGQYETSDGILHYLSSTESSATKYAIFTGDKITMIDTDKETVFDRVSDVALLIYE